MNQTNSTPYNNTATNFTIAGLPEGNHTLICQSEDNSTQVTNSTEITITIDGMPTAEINYPTDAQVFGTDDIEAQVTGTDGINLDYVRLLIDNAVNQTNSTPNNNTATNFTIAGLASGNHTLLGQAEDTLNQIINSTEITITIDTVGPSVVIDAPTAGQEITTDTTELNITVTDIYSSVDTCIHELNSANTTMDNCTDATLTLSLGVNTLNVYANDSLDNWGSAGSIVFYLNQTHIMFWGIDSTGIYTEYPGDNVEMECFFDEYACEPLGQTSTVPAFIVENNGTTIITGLNFTVNETVTDITPALSMTYTGTQFNITNATQEVWTGTFETGTNQSVWYREHWDYPDTWESPELEVEAT